MHFYWAQLHLSVNNPHTALHLDYFPMKMVATVLFESSKEHPIKSEYPDQVTYVLLVI